MASSIVYAVNPVGPARTVSLRMGYHPWSTARRMLLSSLEESRLRPRRLICSQVYYQIAQEWAQACP